MNRILYVGMDVHTTSFTLCCYDAQKDEIFATAQMAPDYKNILKYFEQLKKSCGNDFEILCGYEAGCLGYSLFHQLSEKGAYCVILAPSSMPQTNRREIKTDKRDAAKIARCLAFNTYSAVHIPTEEDNAVKECIRMRDDEMEHLKGIKKRVIAFCTRNGKQFKEGKSYWTQMHISWLKSLSFSEAMLQEAFGEYLALYFQSLAKVEMFDKRINEISHSEEYEQRVNKLICFAGIKERTALATIVETGDFSRFATASQYASYLGLVPGESSSGSSRNVTGITKSGNCHIRRLLVESAQCYSRGRIGEKPKLLAKRQEGCDPKDIAYADRACDRLKRKFNKMRYQTKKHNVTVAAVARELACFIWGMMTGNTA
ncbi:MAG: IS110 family transposase [Eubacteriaceae bacterium]|nr:IS110 family transposase [Eubacteriaceae bacterium]